MNIYNFITTKKQFYHQNSKIIKIAIKTMKHIEEERINIIRELADTDTKDTETASYLAGKGEALEEIREIYKELIKDFDPKDFETD